MKPKLLLSLAPVLTGALFSFASQAWAQTNYLTDFSRYPQTEAFRFFVSRQTNGAAQLAATNLLAITSFLGVDKVVLNYCVREDGHETDCREVYNWAVQASHEKQLSSDSMKSLRVAIGELPVQNELPPVGRLVMVGFSNGTNWVTRSYDNNALPEAMRKIYKIIQP